MSQASAAEPVYHYVISETGPATSLDPLDADNTANLPVARMIYATPLEASADNRLTSALLTEFSFDKKTNMMKWVVKPDLKYDDGTAITPDDIAFAVARMTYVRPTFPVIEMIKGVKEWAKSTEALKRLPDGLRVEGHKITIKFTRQVKHPLFRFCLELFSVIPKRCVDLKTNKIICQSIPASGYYRIVSTKNDSIDFAKRNDQKIGETNAPRSIRFHYNKPTDILKSIDQYGQSSILAGNELMYQKKQIASLTASGHLRFTPAARFSALLLNPNQPPFEDKRCRQLFAKFFRASFRESGAFGTPLEASIFTKIIPGYLNVEELEPKHTDDQDGCRERLRKAKISWGYPETEESAALTDIMKLTFDKIGITTPSPVVTRNRIELGNRFAAGEVSIVSGGSGFWAIDPAGDVKMLFTPNLHSSLKFVAQDKHLQALIEDLDKKPLSYANLNRYIADEANLIVYTHTRRFFASGSNSLLADIPFAITSPAPWQVFRVKK